MVKKDLHEANRLSWNAATAKHNTHKGDQAKFLREGGTTLHAEEIELLGEVKGKTLLHLQCNSGQDTLSLVKHLGVVATGVDISDEAINFAQKLSADSGIPATFVRSDVYDWFAQNDQQFDIAFMSYGTLIWLSDINALGQGIANALKTGGRYVIVDFHPLPFIFGDNWQIEYDYMNGVHHNFDGVGDYVAECSGKTTGTGVEIEKPTETFKNPHPSHEFTWGLADIITALLNAGLTLTTLREYPYSNGFGMQGDMVEREQRRMYAPENKPQNLPFMFGIVAQK